MNAIQGEVDPQNTHMLLGGLMLCVQDSALFEECADVNVELRQTSPAPSDTNLLSSGTEAGAHNFAHTHCTCQRHRSVDHIWNEIRTVVFSCDSNSKHQTHERLRAHKCTHTQSLFSCAPFYIVLFIFHWHGSIVNKYFVHIWRHHKCLGRHGS